MSKKRGLGKGGLLSVAALALYTMATAAQAGRWLVAGAAGVVAVALGVAYEFLNIRTLEDIATRQPVTKPEDLADLIEQADDPTTKRIREALLSDTREQNWYERHNVDPAHEATNERFFVDSSAGTSPSYPGGVRGDEPLSLEEDDIHEKPVTPDDNVCYVCGETWDSKPAMYGHLSNHTEQERRNAADPLFDPTD